MSVHNKVPVKTPSQALRIADFDFLNWSRLKQSNRQSLQPRRSMAAPTSRAKRMVDLLAEIMPPPGTNNTASKKSTRSYIQIQKNYMSTSKKQLHNRKTDHAVVRRALNFIGNNADDVQTHPKSKPITQKLLPSGSKYKCDDVKSNVGSIVKTEPVPVSPKVVKNVSVVNSLNNSHRYDLRSCKVIGKINLDKTVSSEVPVNYTQYRNVNQSFDASICEENSPKVKTLEKSVFECNEKPQIQSDVSDLLCDMLIKTEITPSNLYPQIHVIQSKIQENVKIINAQMNFLNRISTEVENNKKILSSCVENNKLMMEITTDLLNTTRSREKVHSDKTRSSTSLLEKRSVLPMVNKVVHRENNINEEVNDSKKGNDSLLELDLLHENKENREAGAIKQIPTASYNDLRKTLLLATLENNKNKKCIPPSPQTSFKGGDQQIRQLKMVKPSTPKIKASPKTNTFKVDSAKTSKSLQIYKSLKDSVKFLKTPVGKRPNVSDINFETPNTRSRNITSNNIKRQLESLYDS